MILKIRFIKKYKVKEDEDKLNNKYLELDDEIITIFLFFIY